MSLFLILFTIAIFIESINSHAFLSIPRSRNAIGDVNNIPQLCSWNYPSDGAIAPCFGCPHCMNVEELTTGCGIRQGGGEPYMFGDGPYAFAQTGYYTEYNKGSLVPMKVKIGTFHGGIFEFRIQDIGSNSDPIGSTWQSLPVLTVESFSPVCDNTDLLICPYESCVDERTCAQVPLQPYGDYLNYEQDINVRLPENLECDHCVLQWRYITGNSCPSENFAHCESSEQFWNCADIKIVSDGSPVATPVATPVTTPVTAPTMSMAPIDTSTSQAPSQAPLDNEPWNSQCLCQFETGCVVDSDCCPGQVCGYYGMEERLCVENNFYYNDKTTLSNPSCKATLTAPNVGADDFGCVTDADCCNPFAKCGDNKLCSFPVTCSNYNELYTGSPTTTYPTENPSEEPTTASPTVDCSSRCRANIDSSLWYASIVDDWCLSDCTSTTLTYPERCLMGCRV